MRARFAWLRRKSAWIARDEFAWRQVNPVLLLLLAGFAGLLLLARASMPDYQRPLKNLPPPPSYELLKLVAGGENATAARLLALRLQTFDAQSGQHLAIRNIDTNNLVAWLERAARLDPARHYPYMLAANVYNRGDAERSLAMARFVKNGFVAHPDGRWQYLAQLAVLIRHTLDDPATARDLAVVLRQHAPASAPQWVRQMEIFFLEDMGELEAARQIVIAIVESGAITDPAEINYLVGNLLKRLDAAR